MSRQSIIQSDYYRISGKWEKFPLLKGFINPGFRFIYFLRKSQQTSSKNPLGIFYRLILRQYQLKFGFQISHKTQIGAGLYLGHWGTIVINPKAKIGKNCNIAHGVTIGQTNRGQKQGVPQIGDNVWIGTNSVLVGNIKIGNNVLIAPLTYVNENIPDNCIVSGNPMQIFPKENATEGYLNNLI